MNNFPSDYIENIPGIASFKFIPVDDVDSVGDPEGDVISSLTLIAEKSWLEGYSLPDSLIPEEKGSDTKHGSMTNVSLNGALPKDCPTLLAYLNNLKQYRYLVAYKDLNGYWKLFGSLDSPCLFEFNLVKSKLDNRYEYSFKAVHLNDPPYFIDSSLF